MLPASRADRRRLPVGMGLFLRLRPAAGQQQKSTDMSELLSVSSCLVVSADMSKSESPMRSDKPRMERLELDWKQAYLNLLFHENKQS